MSKVESTEDLLKKLGSIGIGNSLSQKKVEPKKSEKKSEDSEVTKKPVLTKVTICLIHFLGRNYRKGP
jgi:hypothetical protein